MPPRIVFMGTPEFAVPSLDILLRHDYPVVGVITATDKYGGRGGKQLLESAVKRHAREHDLPILQPRNLKDPGFQADLAALRADLQIVVAFRMLPQAVWAMPPLGTFNLHASLLPRYRGAAPINWAVINGDRETGVTTFFIQEAIDTGDILLQTSTPIGPDETAGDVHDRLMHIGADLVLETVRGIADQSITPQPQSDEAATPAPKLFHDTCRIDFNQPTQQVHNFIRGLSPYPAAWTTLDGQELKILRTAISDVTSSDVVSEPGSLRIQPPHELLVATADGWLAIHELQLQGRRRMTTTDFLNGYRLGEDAVLSR